MSDPRNVAHDKKVIQAKKHHGEDPAAGAVAETVQPGKKPEMEHAHEHDDPATERADAAIEEAAAVKETVEAHAERSDIHKHP